MRLRACAPPPPLTAAPIAVPPDLAAGLGIAGASLRVQRAWPRGPGRLLLELLDRDGVRVAGQWVADPDRLGRIAARTAQGAPAGAVAVVPGTGVLVQARGADRRLEALARLAAEPGAALVLHRPERRAVLRVEASARPAYRKLLRPGRTEAVVAAAAAAAALAGRPLRWAVPEVIAHDPHAGSVTFAALPGASLRDLVEAGVPPPPGAAAALGGALRALHDAEPPAGLPARDAAAEVAWAGAWVSRVEAFHTGVDALSAALGAARARLGASPPGPLGPVHADLHDGQVLLAAGPSGPAIGLLDWDTLARGEAALDLATLLVRLEARALAGAPWPLVGDLAGAVIEAYRPSAGLEMRVRDYVVLARLRLACQCTFRPPAAPLVGALLARLAEPPPGL